MRRFFSRVSCAARAPSRRRFARRARRTRGSSPSSAGRRATPTTAPASPRRSPPSAAPAETAASRRRCAVRGRDTVATPRHGRSAAHADGGALRVQARRRARARGDARVPGADVRELGVERLPDGGAKIDGAIENDVRDGESVVDDEAVLGEEPIEPGDIVAYGRLQALGGLRHDTHPRLEELEPLREAEAVVEVFGDLELDAPLPHARLGALLGAGADERRPRVLLLEVLEDRDRLR